MDFYWVSFLMILIVVILIDRFLSGFIQNPWLICRRIQPGRFPLFSWILSRKLLGNSEVFTRWDSSSILSGIFRDSSVIKRRLLSRSCDSSPKIDFSRFF